MLDATRFLTLVEDVKGHVLTRQIMAGFLKRAFGGDIRQRDRVKFEKADEYFHFQRREPFAFPIGQSFRGTLNATNEQKLSTSPRSRANLAKVKPRIDRRTFVLRTAGAAASCLLPSRLALAQTDSLLVRRFVRDYQEKTYVRLADELGLPSAKTAYEKIAGRRMPSDLEARYRSVALPTPYEDPYMYPIMTKTFDLLNRETEALGAPALPHPFLATLASGDVHARTIEEPETKTSIVFFEHGLFSFFYDMANLMASAAPPLTEAQLTDDTALAQVPRKYTMPLRASEYFAGTLYAYVVSGSPVTERPPIPEPSDNLGLAIRLLNHMERFVMAHELAHLREGHLNKPEAPALEYEADRLAVSLVTTLADKNHGSWAIGYWGAELALVALHLLFKAIALFTFGPVRPTWISRTHPDPLKRRENLRDIWLNQRSPQAGVAAAREMSGMMEALFSKLWEISAAAVFLPEYEHGKRASPRWKKTAQAFAAGKP